jgi:hypothetical protein
MAEILPAVSFAVDALIVDALDALVSEALTGVGSDAIAATQAISLSTFEEATFETVSETESLESFASSVDPFSAVDLDQLPATENPWLIGTLQTLLGGATGLAANLEAKKATPTNFIEFAAEEAGYLLFDQPILAAANALLYGQAVVRGAFDTPSDATESSPAIRRRADGRPEW